MINKRFFKAGAIVYGVGLGAGIAAALLFSLSRQVTVQAMLMACLSPLPIMIATLGFGGLAGATAVAAASVTVAALVAPEYLHAWSWGLEQAASAGLQFCLTLGLPALGLSFLAALSRPKGSSSWSVTNSIGRSFARDYTPLEWVLAGAVAISAAISVAWVVYFSVQHGGPRAALDSVINELTPVLKEWVAAHPLPDINLHTVAEAIALSAPPFMAASYVLFLMLNLWLAGRVVEVSGHLPRPWPDIPLELRLSRIFAAAFAVAAAGAFVGGLAGLIAAIVAAALAMGFALQGLAVMHYLSRGIKFRTALLAAIYVGIFVLTPWPLFLFTLVGLAEALLSLRDRRSKAQLPNIKN